MSKIYPRLFLFLVLALALGAAFYSGQMVGQREANLNQPATVEGVDLSSFWQSWHLINERFVDVNSGTSTQVVSDQEKVWGAIEGLVASLGDPYSDFMPPKDRKLFDEDISGQFGGIGIEIGVRDGSLTVISPLKDSPAERAGLKSGDRISRVNDTELSKLSVVEATNLIRGKIGTRVKVTIEREGEKKPLDFQIIREVIRVPTIETKVLPEHIFLIKLFNFGATAPELFRKALIEFIHSGDDKMIIDLRGNPGGYLEAAVDIASWFLPPNQVVAIEDHGLRGGKKLYKTRGHEAFNEKLKLVILVDGGSASASEILAGALSEYGRAKLVGEKTFGKGSVQELIPITNDTSLKLTIARWLTPKGVSISHNGLTPDILVKRPTVKEENKPKSEDDLILKAGIKALE